MSHRFREVGLGASSFKVFYPLHNLYAVSMAWLVYSGNLIMIYIFLEITLITSFLLIYYYGYGNRQFVGILYFVWTHVASVLALLGFIIVALGNGTTDLSAALRFSPIASLLVLVGMLIKLPAVGPHIWLPYAHAEAPTPVSALLSPLTVGLAGYVLARIYIASPSFADFIVQARDPLLTYGIITGIYGALSVIRQRDYKRLLAYSTVSQMGYMLIGLVLGTFGIVGLALQYVSHALGKAILFMTAGVIITEYGLRDMGRMGGLHTQLPTVSSAAVLGFMAITGIVTVGLLAEFYILLGLSSTMGLGAASLPYLLGVVLIFILSVVYGFYTIRAIFYGTP
jgi:NADH-quinone oxidoreductase subunit M